MPAPFLKCFSFLLKKRYKDLFRLFEYGNFPPQFNSLFVCGIMDRGERILETLRNWVQTRAKIRTKARNCSPATTRIRQDSQSIGFKAAIIFLPIFF